MEDVRQAAVLLLEFVDGKSSDEYRASALIRAAVERQFIIVGEALSRLDRSFPQVAATVTDCRKIIAFRNILLHGYEVIDDAIVWQVIRSNVPILLAEVSKHLANAPDHSDTE